MAKFKLGKWYYSKEPEKRDPNAFLQWTPDMDILNGMAFVCTQTLFNDSITNANIYDAFLDGGFTSCGMVIDWVIGPFETREEAREAYLRSQTKVRPKPSGEEAQGALRIEADIIEAASQELSQMVDQEILDDFMGYDPRAFPGPEYDGSTFTYGEGLPVTHKSQKTRRKRAMGSAVIKKNGTAEIKVHSKLWREIMRDTGNKGNGFGKKSWKLKVKRRPVSDEKYIVPIRGGDNRIEELPSGKTVFYINVEGMRNSEVPKFLEKVRKDLFREMGASTPLDNINDRFEKAVKQQQTLIAKELDQLNKDYNVRIAQIWSKHDSRMASRMAKRKAKQERLNPSTTEKSNASKGNAALAFVSVAAIAGSVAHLWPYLILLL